MMKHSIWVWILIVVFALFFAHDVWEGVGNFLGVQSTHFSLGISISLLGWVTIIVDVLAPIVLFVLALVITRRMTAGRTFFVFLLALAISAVVGADLALGTNAASLFEAV